MKRDKLSMKESGIKRNVISIALSAAIGIQVLAGGLSGEQVYGASGPVTIDAANFPDEAFRNYVKNNFDTDGNGTLSEAECAAVTKIEVDELGITDLTGIEFFAGINYLSCDKNSLSSLDVSQNTALVFLDCSENLLGALDVSSNPALQYLFCIKNELNALDVSSNPNLTTLACGINNLSTLDISANPKLTILDCGINELSTLDVSRNAALTELMCEVNHLNNLDVSQNPALEELWCHGNDLTSLDVSHNPALKELWCYENNLTSLDVSHNPVLEKLWCYENKLTSLDLSANPAIDSLICYDNGTIVTAYHAGDTYYVDLSGLSLDKSRVENLGAGSYSAETGRITFTTPVAVGDVVRYNYAAGQGDKVMLVSLEITEVIENGSTDTGSVSTVTPDTVAPDTTTPGTVATGSSEQKPASPKTGDMVHPVWTWILCLFSMGGVVLFSKKKGLS